MSALNRPDNFAGRVNYAAAVISSGRKTSRAFDNCFENWDGDEVVTILIRRAENNPRLAANLFRYISKDSATEAAERLKDISTRDMPAHAAATRAECKRRADESYEKHRLEQEAICQRGRDSGYTVAQTGPYEWTAYRPDGTSLPPKMPRESGAWYFAGMDAAERETATAA